MSDNGPHLSTGTFCPVGRFVRWDVLSPGRFVLKGLIVLKDLLYLRTYCPMGRFVRGTFCLRTFCLGTFSLVTFCLGTFGVCMVNKTLVGYTIDSY